MKKRVFNPVINLKLTEGTVTLSPLEDTIKIQVKAPDYQLEYEVEKKDDEIDKEYTFTILKFQKYLEELSGKNNLKLIENQFYEETGKKPDIEIVEHERIENTIDRFTSIQIPINESNNYYQVEAKLFDNINRHQNIKMKLAMLPELDGIVIGGLKGNHNPTDVFFTTTDGMGVLQSKFRHDKSLEHEYALTFEMMKNMLLKQLKITKYDEIMKYCFKEDGNNLTFQYILENKNQAFQNIICTIKVNAIKATWTSQFYDKYIDSILGKECEINKDIDYKAIGKLISAKNKAVGGTGKKYNVFFSILKGCLMDNDEPVIKLVDDENFNIPIINAYDFISIFEGCKKIKYGNFMFDEFLVLDNGFQRLILKQ